MCIYTYVHNIYKYNNKSTYLQHSLCSKQACDGIVKLSFNIFNIIDKCTCHKW